MVAQLIWLLVFDFVVAVVYETRAERMGATGELTVARPSLDIEVLETKYDLHLPDGYAVTGFDGDLVPLTMREREGLLDATWVDDEAPHPRKYYRLTRPGARRLAEMEAEWRAFTRKIDRLIEASHAAQ